MLDKEKPSLILEAKSKETENGKGRMSVTASDKVQYRVTAKKAKNVNFELDFNPTLK